MRTSSQIFAVLVILYSSIVHSQITITSEDILNLIGKTHIYEWRSGQIPVNVGSSEGNQVWDFRNISGFIEDAYPVDYVDPKDTPFSTDFPEATFCEKTDPSFYTFYLVNDSSYNVLGEASVLEDTTFITHAPPEQDIPLPLTLGMSWTRTTVDTFPNQVLKMTDNSEIDAWGTMLLPGGDFECLRERQEFVAINEYLSEGMVISADTSRYIAYIWLSKSAFFIARASPSTYDPNFGVAESVTRLLSQNITFVNAPNRESLLIKNFKLMQNYPNPFNSETNIYFEMQIGSQVELTIYNLLGEMIDRLINDYLPLGEYKIKWQTKELPSGIYFARLKGAGLVETRKLLLQK